MAVPYEIPRRFTQFKIEIEDGPFLSILNRLANSSKRLFVIRNAKHLGANLILKSGMMIQH